MAKKVLVIGGAGFIGSHTTDALIQAGYKVRILDNLSKPVHLHGKPDYINNNAEFVLGDIRNKKDIKNVLTGIDYIFHFAAYQDYLTDFSKFFDVNSVGTAMIYEVIVEENLSIKKVVIASSQAVYGEGKYICKNCGIIYPNIRTEKQLKKGEWEINCPKCGSQLKSQPTDEKRVNPQNQYAISKFTQELIGLNLGKRYNIPTTCLRYSIVQGPRQSLYNPYSGACRIFSLSLFLNQAPVIFEDGGSLRDYVNINDVVKANLLVLNRNDSDFKVYNVGGGKAFTVLEFYDIVKKIFNKDILAEISGEYRFGDTRHIVSDVSKLKSLGWQPQYTPEKSVTDYKQWLLEQKGFDEILSEAYQKMRNMGVIKQSNS